MGRDLRQIGCNRNKYPDKCYLYDSSAVNKNKLVMGSTPLCRFYKRDLISFQWERVTINGVLTTTQQFVGTIETMDHIEKARPDMYVLDNNGMLFKISTPIVSDDANKSKVVGTRATVKTTMRLVGVEKYNG